MMRSFLLLALAIAAVTAFAPPARHGVIMATQRTMFSPNADEIAESPSPLEVVGEGESVAPVVADTSQSTIAPRTMIVKNLAKGGEVKQVNFYDPAMRANTNPLQMEWWAYILVTFPFVLLANDFLHFLPTEGPLAFLSTY